MITEEESNQAKELIRNYDLLRSKEAIQSLRCICCAKPIIPEQSFLTTLNALNKGAWKDGSVALITFWIWQSPS